MINLYLLKIEENLVHLSLEKSQYISQHKFSYDSEEVIDFIKSFLKMNKSVLIEGKNFIEYKDGHLEITNSLIKINVALKKTLQKHSDLIYKILTS